MCSRKLVAQPVDDTILEMGGILSVNERRKRVKTLICTLSGVSLEERKCLDTES